MNISWGKPNIYVRKLETGKTYKWRQLKTPVENSTELVPTKGDKKEAKIEGGGNEDVINSKNTYALSMTFRLAKGETKPFEDTDGVVSDEYEVMLQPEDAAAYGIHIEKARVSLEDSYNADGGIENKYTFDAIKPSSGNTVKWGVVAVTGTTGSLSLSFTEVQAESDVEQTTEGGT